MFKLGRLRFGALLCAGLLLVAEQADAAKRVALIIGNDSYQGLPKLNNARTDARGMDKKLKILGFDTVLAVDANLRDIGKSLRKFESKLQNADVALVFYAGHGIQANGENYLIPVDAKLEHEDDLNFGGGVPLKQVISSMKRGGSDLNLIILDACRDNPLPKSGRSSGTSRGLVVTSVPAGLGAKGTAILYSAAPGQIAQDGPKGGHGVFTGALLKVISTPGTPVEQVFKKTAALVSDKTGGKQEPWMNSSIKGDFFFKAGQTPVRTQQAVPAGGANMEAMFWQSISNSKDASDYEEYLAQFPNGTFSGLAAKRMKQYVKPASTAFEVVSIDKTMWVAKNSTVNVRSGPSKKYSKIARLKGYTKVSVTGDVVGSSWLRVNLNTDEEGYVLGTLLSASKVKKRFQVASLRNLRQVGFKEREVIRPLCTVQTTGGSCQVEGFLESIKGRLKKGELRQYSCIGMDKLYIQGRCENGKLNGVAIAHENGIGWQGGIDRFAKVRVAYFVDGTPIYPILSAYKKVSGLALSDTKNIGYGCAFFGEAGKNAWDSSKTRNECPAFGKAMGNPWTKKWTQDLVNGKITPLSLERYLHIQMGLGG